MKVLWFISFSILVFLTGIFANQAIIWIAELLLIDIYFTRLINWKSAGIRVSVKIPVWANLALWLIMTTLIIRLFAFDSITARNTGMQPGVRPGDNIIVLKTSFGPRLPLTPIAFPFAHHYLPLTRKPSYLSKPSIPYTRLNGLSKIKRGEPIAYNYPEGDTLITGAESVSYYGIKRAGNAACGKVDSDKLQFRPVDRRNVEISRIMAIPGDTVMIIEGEIHVNSFPAESGKERLPYLLNKDINPAEKGILKEFDIYEEEIKIVPGKGYILNLTTNQADKIKIREGMASLKRIVRNKNTPNKQVFPHSKNFMWNPDFFGPLVVPGKGQIIHLNKDNYPLYERLIRVYEGNGIRIEGNDIYINGIKTDSYIIKMDYYFLAGDNRELSRDSRHWGFLPEDHIIGKPCLIWLSLSPLYGKRIVKWNRIFDIVN